MKIQYICHSCIYIDTGDTTMVIDPWIKGPAYKNQWFLFPKPVDYSMLKEVKNILYSHGHEDHLHEESLQELPQSAQVFYPYQWRTGVKSFLMITVLHISLKR
jgi:L-ascorbate metabolism protein UlaG (beta-lactamase superfamily)